MVPLGFLFPEPDVASSDATNMECTFYADGENYVINGKKWWSSGESFSFNGFKKKKKEKFVFHFRIDPVLRDSGLGKQATSLLPRSTGFELLLEVITEKKTTGNIKTTQGGGLFIFFIANEVALTESTEC